MLPSEIVRWRFANASADSQAPAFLSESGSRVASSAAAVTASLKNAGRLQSDFKLLSVSTEEGASVPCAAPHSSRASFTMFHAREHANFDLMTIKGTVNVSNLADPRMVVLCLLLSALGGRALRRRLAPERQVDRCELRWTGVDLQR